MRKAQLISFFEALAPLTAEDKDFIRSRCTSLKIPARTFLVQEGEVAHSVYFILEGCARCGINCPTGEDISAVKTSG